MRRALFLVPLLFLAACETPREACINNAMREQRTLNALVETTRANIARGYGLADQQEVRTRPDLCTGTDATGAPITVRCEKTEVTTVQVPVAIDLNAERAKLTSLLERHRLMESQTSAVMQQCIAAYPE